MARRPGEPEQSEPAVLKIWGRVDHPPEVGERPGPGEEFPGETGRFGALALVPYEADYFFYRGPSGQ